LTAFTAPNSCSVQADGFRRIQPTGLGPGANSKASFLRTA
jgi:hypothetical protein